MEITLYLSPLSQQQIERMTEVAKLAVLTGRTFEDVKNVVSDYMRQGMTFEDAWYQTGKDLRPRIEFKDNIPSDIRWGLHLANLTTPKLIVPPD